jgi:hypothetical protein
MHFGAAASEHPSPYASEETNVPLNGGKVKNSIIEGIDKSRVEGANPMRV